MYTYIEIRKTDTEEVVKRLNTTGKSQRQIEGILMYYTARIDTDKYYVIEHASETQLAEIII